MSRAGANGFKGTGAFKPPRPRPSTGSRASTSATAATHVHVIDDDDDEPPHGENGREEAADEPTDVASDAELPTPAAPALPPALLARLLSHFFQNPKGTPTRLTQDAHAAVDKYMEIFVREAVARSMAARSDGAFLDVEILQKVAGQLIMDM